MHDRYLPVELYDVTDITDHSFTANWEPAPESEGYRVDVTEILPEEENPVIVEEDFASMDEFEYPKSGYDEISGDLDYYTKYPGWTGESLYESGNCVRVGGYGVNGYLATPLFDASSDEKITLALRTQGYPGKSVNVAVELCDEEGTALEAYTYKGNKDLVENVWNFTNLQGARTIKISTTNERVFVHDMRILHGCVAPEDVWTVGPKSWSVFAEADNYCVGDGLRPEHSYFFNVITLAEEELKCSQPSETMYVTTLPGTGVEAIDADSNQDAAYFDLMGRKVDNPSVSGLYIKRQGNKVNKLILK